MEASPSASTATSDPKSLLRRALDCLNQREFSSSQKLAAQALESDPSLASAGRILIAAGVLLAGERRDLYAVLGVSRAEAEDSELVWARFAKLAGALASPELNDVAFAQEAYDLAYEAWRVLSDSQRRTQYDAEVADRAGAGAGDGEGHAEADAASFWTVCPYCYCMFQYGKAYEECCLRCQSCSRAFHGAAIADPPPEIIVPGKDQYFACYGVFPLAYKPGNAFNVRENVGEKEEDDLNAADNREGLTRGSGRWGKRVAKAPARRMRNVKSVANKKKKKKMMIISDCEEESETEKEGEDDGEENNGGGGNLVFYDGDGDLFVGLEHIPS